jgi:hypothetical protein
MSNRSKSLLFGAVLPAALLLPLLAGSPALADAMTSAEFALATCRNAVGDLTKVDAMAQEGNWTAAPEAAAGGQAKGFKLRSAWNVTKGDDRFFVMTGTGEVPGTAGDSTVCMVMFPGMQLQRNPFFGVMSAALELKPQADVTFPQGHMEMFEIKSDGPAKQILQLMSLNDGNVMMASMVAMPVPATPQPAVAATQVDSSVRAFRALDADTVYVLGTDAKLWREFGMWNNTLQPRIEVDGNVKAFQPLDVHTVYVLGADGNLWREFDTGNDAEHPREQVDGNVRAFQALDANTVYVLGADGNLWREFGARSRSQPTREHVDGTVRAFQAINSSIVYVLGTDGKLWREVDTWNNKEPPRVLVDFSVRAFQALDSSIVYVLGNDGKLWREYDTATYDEQPRVEVDYRVKAFQALDAETVYVLGTDGNLWREQGTLRTRTKVAANVLAFQAVDDTTVYVLCPGDILFRMQVPHEVPVAEQSR